jgi:hypothetical protein
MEQDKLRKFIESVKNIKLSDDEKNTGKQTLLNFISNNPVRPGLEHRLQEQSRAYAGGWSSIFLTKLNFASAMSIFLILSVLVSGGLAVGAEKSLPGDILYPIKVGINEEVQGWLAVSEESKTDWEIKRAERRLEEAEELAENGTLDAEVSEKIEANFEANAERVRQRIEKFHDKENFKAAASVSLNFETALKAHEKILTRLSEKKEVEARVRPIRMRVNAEVNKAAKNRQEMDVKLKIQEKASVENDDEVKGEIDVNNEENIELNSNEGSVESNTQVRVKLGL